jgi:hypothetical protein
MFAEMLETQMEKQLLKAAVMRQIFCPCGRILDVRDAVLVEFAHRMRIMCGKCFHEPQGDRQAYKTVLAEVLAEAKQNHPDIDIDSLAKVYDGKVLSKRNRTPRKRIPKDSKPGKAFQDRYPSPTEPEPTMDVLEGWMLDGTAEATDGCTVEPDGTCEHGHPSWLRYLGLM